MAGLFLFLYSFWWFVSIMYFREQNALCFVYGNLLYPCQSINTFDFSCAVIHTVCLSHGMYHDSNFFNLANAANQTRTLVIRCL